MGKMKGKYVVSCGIRPPKEKINIFEEFINKGSGRFLHCSDDHTPLRVGQQATILWSAEM